MCNVTEMLNLYYRQNILSGSLYKSCDNSTIPSVVYTVNPERIASVIFNDFINPATLTSLYDNDFSVQQ